jgi:hypothetical protein
MCKELSAYTKERKRAIVELYEEQVPALQLTYLSRRMD